MEFKDLLNWFQLRPVHHNLSSYHSLVSQIKQRKDLIHHLDDVELKSRYRAIHHKVQNTFTGLDFIIEVFALVLEISERVLNMRLFDVQLIAGLVLNEGNVVDMQTGEANI